MRGLVSIINKNNDDNVRTRADSFSSRGFPGQSGRSAGTLPRPHQADLEPRSSRLSVSSQNLAETDLEKLYSAMKNLTCPLPNSPGISDKMPALHSVPGVEAPATSHSMDDLCSVIGDIPPSMAPVQSHAVLEFGLGHTIPLAPRTPASARKLDWSPAKSAHPLPPIPPKRTASRVGELGRPSNLNLPSHDHSIYSRPRLVPDRSSLMSTGSSDSGTGSSSEPDQPLSPGTLSQFSYQDSASLYSEANTSMTSHSGLYVKMRPGKVFSGEGAEYMNFLYSAVQCQGGAGTVESALSPYLAMNAPAASSREQYSSSLSSTISHLYDKIDSSRGSLQQVSRQTSREEAERSRALDQFRNLMEEVEQKRRFRVGLNLFNTIPDVGIDYLVKQSVIELSPLSVAKFLFKNPSLAKAKIGEYLGQFESAFCMKVLSLFVQEFDFAGLRIDKAIRKLLTFVKIPSSPDRVEKIMAAFVKRFVKCNPGQAGKAGSQENLVVVACAIVALNKEIHTNNKKISEKEFVSSVCRPEAESKVLRSVYRSVKKKAVVSEGDHVTQTSVLQQSLLPSSAPHLAASHRRLVCLCSLFQVKSINTESESEVKAHPRVVWLFNDLLVIVKPTGKGGSNIYKENITLLGMEVSLFKSGACHYGLELVRKRDKEVMATFCLETEQDQYKLVMDLQESIFEMETMHRAAREANMIK